MTYHLVFDKFPSPEGSRFIELEDSTGHSISAGEWRERKDGYVELVLPAPAGWYSKELEWKNGEARSKEGNLYSVHKLSGNVWTTKWNGVAFTGWSSREEDAKIVAQEHYAAYRPATLHSDDSSAYAEALKLREALCRIRDFIGKPTAALQQVKGIATEAVGSPPKPLSYEGEQS